MAERPVFISNIQSENLFTKKMIEFEWFPGFSVKQKQKSIQSLHYMIKEKCPNIKVLEISSKSDQELGVKLSAFNLIIKTKNNLKFSVETAFQASKVFENAGPFVDLYKKSSKEAKRDTRLKENGKLVAFKYFNREFSINPKTFFYNWLYINTLATHFELAEEILEYNAFTDIEFNPYKSVNCQAEAAAIYVSLVKSNLLKDALSSIEIFKSIVYKESEKNEMRKEKSISEQIKLL